MALTNCQVPALPESSLLSSETSKFTCKAIVDTGKYHSSSLTLSKNKSLREASKCGSLELASRAPTHDSFHADALETFKKMLHCGVQPTPLTFSSLLRSCADAGSLCMGRQIHSQIIVHGFSSNTILESALIAVYTRCGEVGNGRQIFETMGRKNAITWNSMIRGYSQIGNSEQALYLFGLMRRDGLAPDSFTFPALLAGATSAGSELLGEFTGVHAYAIKVGLERDCFVGSSLIAMYSTNGFFQDARQAFDSVSSKDVGVWSSIISANIKAQRANDALDLFTEMLNLNFQPNQFIFSSSLTACGQLSILETGKQVHASCLKSNDAMDTATQNSLISMYSNCGCIEEARRVFNSLEEYRRNVISFNSMISASAQHGYPKEAAELFEQLQQVGLRPDGITMLNLLSAFNHAGLVREGVSSFSAMVEGANDQVGYRHYACMVDMLSRAGKIDEALRFIIRDMPFEPDTPLWRIVLGACSKHRNLRVAKQVARLLLEMEPEEAANYVLLANVYARSGRWRQAEEVRQLMKGKGIEKEAGFSWIEIDKATHTFGVEDRSHPLSVKIYQKLQELMSGIEAVGYVPDISFTLHDLDGAGRRQSLYYHSEKLAFAFGDLSAARGVQLRIMKNLRVCGDCHNAYKQFSLITNREIVLRDKYRFHHFSKGACSCGDYW
ncbi:pentatricopeptide repeat-containing protein At2g03880, mitochondrial-like [Zingiber officinale]|uniref:DYW domain-containing protein n=1 Tax=Zingiber officinale TaxID=94328 RepID=A0A8J5HVA8_ZINOF|nr:pentatricopeptide repeat-containing protein At2g03880, mitochondrial-like [Zingiber officinale]KAG6532352.1 hypothetical protein ZIOFF_006192 [Zingiber officinale]